MIQSYMQLLCCRAAGIFYFLAEAGAVSALPAHLMSDHVFLGSALVSMLSSEAVLLAKDIRCCSHASTASGIMSSCPNNCMASACRGVCLSSPLHTCSPLDKPYTVYGIRLVRCRKAGLGVPHGYSRLQSFSCVQSNSLCCLMSQHSLTVVPAGVQRRG